MKPIPTALAATALAAALIFTPVVSAPARAITQAEVNATLGADEALWEDLFWLAVADQIRTNCTTIEARRIRATAYIFDLYSRARAYGFDRPQLRAFQTDDATEARMRADVMAYFAERGVREGEPETYCALGQAEIAAGSKAGDLLRAR